MRVICSLKLLNPVHMVRFMFFGLLFGLSSFLPDSPSNDESCVHWSADINLSHYI